MEKNWISLRVHIMALLPNFLTSSKGSVLDIDLQWLYVSINFSGRIIDKE